MVCFGDLLWKIQLSLIPTILEVLFKMKRNSLTERKSEKKFENILAYLTLTIRRISVGISISDAQT